MNAPHLDARKPHHTTGPFPAAAGWVEGRGVNARAIDGTPVASGRIATSTCSARARETTIFASRPRGARAPSLVRAATPAAQTFDEHALTSRIGRPRMGPPPTTVDVIDVLDHHPSRGKVAERTSVSSVATHLPGRAGASPTWASAPSTTELPNVRPTRPASTVRATKLR